MWSKEATLLGQKTVHYKKLQNELWKYRKIIDAMNLMNPFAMLRIRFYCGLEILCSHFFTMTSYIYLSSGKCFLIIFLNVY